MDEHKSKNLRSSISYAVNYSLEKSHRFFVVRDEHIFVVAVMVEHHFVVFARI